VDQLEPVVVQVSAAYVIVVESGVTTYQGEASYENSFLLGQDDALH
jgi:hypothetical protein